VSLTARSEILTGYFSEVAHVSGIFRLLRVGDGLELIVPHDGTARNGTFGLGCQEDAVILNIEAFYAIFAGIRRAVACSHQTDLSHAAYNLLASLADVSGRTRQWIVISERRINGLGAVLQSGPEPGRRLCHSRLFGVLS
jgi:hypothetical protein